MCARDSGCAAGIYECAQSRVQQSVTALGVAGQFPFNSTTAVTACVRDAGDRNKRWRSAAPEEPGVWVLVMAEVQEKDGSKLDPAMG